MKKLFLPICLLIVLVNGCSSGKTFVTPVQKVTSLPNFPEATSIPLSSLPPVSEIPVSSTPVMNIPLPKSQLRSQCLDVKLGLAGNVTSTGIVILNGQYDPNNSGTFLLDMTTVKLFQMTKQGERQINHVVSPDKTLLAYKRILFDTDGKVIQKDFIIANANGQILKTIPVEKNWSDILGWLDNQHLFIRLAASNLAENAGEKPIPVLIINPFNDERKILLPDFPQFLNAPSTTLPYWYGWSGVIYDPTLNIAIYPGFIEGNDEMYTYVLWDMSSKRVIASLENVFVAYILQNTPFPMPRWNPDNSQFVIRGLVPQPDRVIMELYSVSRDGATKQLTHLASTAYIFGSNLSWSPDGRYIAMFLGPVYGAADQKARVAILDMKSFDVTDYCFSVSYSEEGHYSEDNAPAAIWSPNSKQFLVQDWYEKDHSRVILVDIERGVVAQVAENVEAVGWMLP